MEFIPHTNFVTPEHGDARQCESSIASIALNPLESDPALRDRPNESFTRPKLSCVLIPTMSRVPALARAMSTAPRRTSVAGMRAEMQSRYTDTGGSGLDATHLSSTLEEASAKARSVYRTALRDIPEMRKNFTIVEDAPFVRATIRELFERHSAVTDPKIADMLTFKAVQELREIREQWKSRHHVYAYIHQYAEKLLKEAARRSATAGGEDLEELLRGWRERGLVPAEIMNWGMFERWREEEDTKFRAFAVENKLFTEEQLDRNAGASSSCTIM